MYQNFVIALAVGLFAAGTLATIACDEGDGDADVDGDSDTDSDSDGDADGDAGEDPDADEDVIEYPFTFSVGFIDFLLGTPVAGVTCELVDETGDSLDPPVTVTSVGGWCTFGYDTRPASVSLKASASGYMDHYLIDVLNLGEGDVGGIQIQMVSQAALSALAGGLGVVVDASAGILIGAVLWAIEETNTGDVLLLPVGCASATLDNPGDSTTFYINAEGMPAPGLTGTDPAQGTFVVANAPTGAQVVTADVAGTTEIATAPSIAGAITNVIVYFVKSTYAVDPTPPGCGGDAGGDAGADGDADADAD